jgi:hypothetical protein
MRSKSVFVDTFLIMTHSSLGREGFGKIFLGGSLPQPQDAEFEQLTSLRGRLARQVSTVRLRGNIHGSSRTRRRVMQMIGSCNHRYDDVRPPHGRGRMTFEARETTLFHADYHAPMWLVTGTDDGRPFARLTLMDGSCIPLTEAQRQRLESAFLAADRQAARMKFEAALAIGCRDGAEPANDRG